MQTTDAFGNPYRGAGRTVPQTTYAKRGEIRLCANGCPTRLNRYNPGPECLRCRELGRDAGAELSALAGERVH